METERRIWLDHAAGTVDPDFARELRGVLDEGGKDEDVAEILGISANVAKKVRHALGIRFRAAPSVTVPHSRIRSLHAAGLRTREIAARTGLTYRTVQQRLYELGLKANRSATAGARESNLNIRASQREMDHIRESAERAGMSVSVWVRSMLGLGQ